MSPKQYAIAGAAAGGTVLTASPLVFLAISGAGFPRGSYLDAQPKASGNALQRAAYDNYVFGVYMAAAGVPYGVAMQAANTFGMFSHYSTKNGPMDSAYSNLPSANVTNIRSGFNDAISGTWWGVLMGMKAGRDGAWASWATGMITVGGDHL